MGMTGRVYLPRVLTCAAALMFAGSFTACDAKPAAVAGSASGNGSAAAAASVQKPGSGAVLATYSGKQFRESEYEELAERLNPRSRRTLESPERRRALIENHLLSELILARGKDQGLDKDPEVRARLADLERQLIVQRVMQEYQNVPVAEEDIRKFYDDNLADFSTDRVEASHILVAEEELAKSIRAQLAEDASKFADLAVEHSTDKSNSARGGALGFFTKGRMVKEFEEAVFALGEDGQISDPVKTRFGYHVIMRTGREDGQQRPFEEVQNQIRVKLVNEARGRKTEAFLAELRSEAELTINEEAVAALKAPARRGDEPAHGGRAHGGGLPLGHGAK